MGSRRRSPRAVILVDDYSTPEEDASRMGYAELVALLRAASAEK